MKRGERRRREEKGGEERSRQRHRETEKYTNIVLPPWKFKNGLKFFMGQKGNHGGNYE